MAWAASWVVDHAGAVLLLDEVTHPDSRVIHGNHGFSTQLERFDAFMDTVDDMVAGLDDQLSEIFVPVEITVVAE